MNKHPNAAIVRSAYEAMEKGDMTAFAALLDDGIIWHESTPGFAGATRRWHCLVGSSRSQAYR
jgi:ketosteroid isomerase-like protein